MALLNFAKTYAEIKDFLGKSESESGDYVKLLFSKDGHIITHGKDFTPDFSNIERGLVKPSHNSSTEFLRGNNTWANISTKDLPIAISVQDAITNGTTSTTILNTKQIIDYIGNSFAANDAMRYKGTIEKTTSGYITHTAAGAQIEGFPKKCEIGDTYRIKTAGMYAEMKCSPGDLLICIKDGTGETLNDIQYWTAVEANINGEVTHSINNKSYFMYSRNTDQFTIYAPATHGNQGQILKSNGNAAPIWINQTEIIAGTANKVKYALTSGNGIAFNSGTTYDGSAARTISVKPATNSTLGGVIVDKGSTKKTISVGADGNIFLTSDNIINALGFIPGSAANDKIYSMILSSTGNSVDSPTTNIANPFINLIQTQSGNKSVVSSYQLVGVGKISVQGQTNVSISLGEADANNYGGIKLGYTNTGKNYAVQLSEGKAYVNVPWQNTTYSLATATTDGLVPKFDAVGAGSLAVGSWVLAKLANGTYDWFALTADLFNKDTWRPINVNSKAILSNSTSSGTVNFIQGGHTTISASGSNITISSSWRDITIGGTSIGNSTLNFVPSGDIYLKPDTTADGIQDISFGLSWFNISTGNYETA